MVKLCLSLSFCFQDGVVFKNLVSAQESRFKFDNIEHFFNWLLYCEIGYSFCGIYCDPGSLKGLCHKKFDSISSGLVGANLLLKWLIQLLQLHFSATVLFVVEI